MKILVLSRNFRKGSGGAESALADACIKRGFECKVADPSVIVSEAKDETAESGLIRRTHRKIRGVVQKAEDFLDKAMGLISVDLSSDESAEKLFSYITDGVFDAVICTCIQTANAISAVRNLKGKILPCYSVLTDYFVPPYLGDSGLDGYFIPHRDLKDAGGLKGSDANNVEISGIPIKQRFGSDFSKKEARNYLIIPESRKVYLILSQGMSRGTVTAMCDELLKNESGDFTVCVLAERSDEILDRLIGRYQDTRNIQVAAYTEKFSVYMKAADAVISKPNAQTLTEAAAAGVPLVLVPPEGEAEFRNAEFAASHEIAVTSGSAKDAAAKAHRFAVEKALAERIIKMQNVNVVRGAADRIIDLIAKKAAVAQ